MGDALRTDINELRLGRLRWTGAGGETLRTDAGDNGAGVAGGLLRGEAGGVLSSPLNENGSGGWVAFTANTNFEIARLRCLTMRKRMPPTSTNDLEPPEIRGA